MATHRLKLSLSVKNCLTPRGDWELHAVRRLSRKEIASYRTACDKERKAMYTSGVDSEDVNTEQAASRLEPRKHKRPQRYRQTSSDSETESESGSTVSCILRAIAIVCCLSVCLFVCMTVMILFSFCSGCKGVSW